MTHKISETFRSIQGEGTLAGTVSTFIRYAGCNLSCSWCDAAYTWKGNVDSDDYTATQLLAIAEGCEHVVVTGGEPMIQDEVSDLLCLLWVDHHHVTVETNGTVNPSAYWEHVALWSVSPKLGSSGQEEQINRDALESFLTLHAARQGSVQFKFVVDSEGDFDRAILLLEDLGVVRYPTLPIIFQPNGLCHTATMKVDGERVATDQEAGDVFLPGRYEPGEMSIPKDRTIRLETPYLDRFKWLCELVLGRQHLLPSSVRVMPQSHKLAWGNRRGF